MFKASYRYCAVAAALATILTGCNDAGLAGLPPEPTPPPPPLAPGDIEVTPTSLDFGRERVGFVGEQMVQITNVGEADIELTGIEVASGSTSAYWLPTGTPSQSEPIVLPSGLTHSVPITYEPKAFGDFPDRVLIQSSDDDEPTVEVTLAGLAFDILTESFKQGTSYIGGEADLLFVIDNSGSMSDDQQRLSDSFEKFINWLLKGKVDFHIAVTSTDMDPTGEKGAFVGSVAYPWLDATTPQIVDKFKARVNLGATGSGTEQGLAASYAALSDPLLSGAHAGFLRASAPLFIVYVSDEDDQSPNTVASYVSYFQSLKAAPDDVLFMAIAGPSPSGCGGAYAGPRYEQISIGTGGIFDKICQADFSGTLKKLAFAVIPPAGDFPLAELPIVDTIKVTVGGQPSYQPDWYYDAAQNYVRFDAAHIPPDKAAIEITYEVGPPAP